MPNFEGNNEAGNVKINKKPFNKKKWREQRYSCKAKVQKWESIKLKQAQRQYNKELKKLQGFEKSKDPTLRPERNKSLSHLQQAAMQYAEIQRIKEEKRKEQERIKKEKIEAIKIYKEKKAAKFKKLSQKTRKGQPVMKGRIELLLEEIQRKYVKQDNQ